MRYTINAKKLVQLEQVEIEAESEAEAISRYLIQANTYGIGVSDYEWNLLSPGDLDVEEG